MVAADQPYAFHSGPDGFGFLNYRRDASMHTVMSEGVARLGVLNRQAFLAAGAALAPKSKAAATKTGNTDFMRLTSLCCRSIKAVNVGPAAGFPVCRGATFSTRLSGLSDNPAPSHGSAQGRRPSAP